MGGGSFSDDDSDVGVLAGVGLQVDPRLSLNAAWSGVGAQCRRLGGALARNSPHPDGSLIGDVTNNTDAGSVGHP